MADPLALQRKSLETQRETFQGLLTAELPDPATIYLGENYFTSVSKKYAKDFIERRLDVIQRELSALNQLGGVNDEGLPILDIVEELDDNDDVVGSSVNRTGLAEQLENLRLHSQRKSDQPQAPETMEPEQKVAETEAPQARITELQEKGGTAIKPNESKPEEEAVTDTDESTETIDKDLEDKSEGEYRDIDPSDILELQLSNDVESDEEPVNFDFNDLEEEDDELYDDEIDDDDDDDNDDDDDDADDDAVGGHSDWVSHGISMFPQNEATRRLIEAHLKKNTSENASENASESIREREPEKALTKESKQTTEEATTPATEVEIKAEDEAEEKKDMPKVKSDKKSHVRFSDDINVCEFETSVSERKITPADLVSHKPSRFKSLRQAATAKKISERASPQKSGPQRPKVSAAAAAAAAVVNKSPPKSAMQNVVREREPLKMQPKHANLSSPTKPVASARNVGAGSPNKASMSPIKSPVTETVPENPPSKDERSLTTEVGTKEVGTKETPLTDEQLRAKIAKEAESIYEKSFVPDEEFVRLHEHPEKLPADEVTLKAKKEEAKKVEDKPILSASVQERDVYDASGYENDDGDVVDMKEIKREYQRLRQRMIYESGGFRKKDTEKEVEPIAETGEPKKISRFKAARIG